MKFDHTLYDNMTVMHCKDELSHKIFQDYIAENNLDLNVLQAYAKYGNKTCYRFNGGKTAFASYSLYKTRLNSGIKIIEFDSFDWFEEPEEDAEIDLRDFIDEL